MEQFIPINNFENYEISNYGKVRNSTTGRILADRINSSGYKSVILSLGGYTQSFLVHRLVGLYHIPNPLYNKIIDHIDNDQLNNNINNLRWTTIAQNLQNAKLSRRNKSGVKGVTFHTPSQKWIATICQNSKLKHIGVYETIEKASEARYKMALELFGKYMNICEKPINIEVEYV